MQWEVFLMNFGWLSSRVERREKGREIWMVLNCFGSLMDLVI